MISFHRLMLFPWSKRKPSKRKCLFYLFWVWKIDSPLMLSLPPLPHHTNIIKSFPLVRVLSETLVAACLAVFATRNEGSRGFGRRTPTCVSDGTGSNYKRIWNCHSTYVQVISCLKTYPSSIWDIFLLRQNGLCITKIDSGNRHPIGEPTHHSWKDTTERYTVGSFASPF